MTPQSIESLFEQYKSLINSTIRRNRRLLAALRLEHDDVAQDLSIVMLSAIEKFDSKRSDNLAAYLTCKLQYAILDMKRRYKPHGVTGVPRDERLNVLYLGAERPDGSYYEIASADDTSGLEVSELLESLSESETNVVELAAQGYPLRRKARAEALSGARRKYNQIYKSERRIAA